VKEVVIACNCSAGACGVCGRARRNSATCRVISAGFGCRERGDSGVYIGGAGLARGLGLRGRDRIRRRRREA
jgi:hypothetical protein